MGLQGVHNVVTVPNLKDDTHKTFHLQSAIRASR
jgi:hypothetical protein